MNNSHVRNIFKTTYIFLTPRQNFTSFNYFSNFLRNQQIAHNPDYPELKY